MDDEIERAMSAFYLACVANPEIQALLPKNPSAAELANVLKQYAFQETLYVKPASRHFLVALLDTVDWTLLATRLLTLSAQNMDETTNEGAPSLDRSFKAA